MRLTLGSVCSGVGGFDLGLEMTGGFVTRWQIEIDEWRRSVLRARWPDATHSVTDLITATDDDFAALSPVDAVCAGLPCQPISVAGDRLAIDDPRWLLPHFFRLLRVLRPRFVLYENPPGILSPIKRRGVVVQPPPIAHLLGGLAALGYDAEWYVLGADDIGAPHERKRVWLLADRDGLREPQPEGCQSVERRWIGNGSAASVADTTSERFGTQLGHAHSGQCDSVGSGEMGHAATARPSRRASGSGGPVRHESGRAESDRRGAVMVNAASLGGHTGGQPLRRTSAKPLTLIAGKHPVEHASGERSEEPHPSRIAGDARHVAGRSDALADTDDNGTEQPLGICGSRTASEFIQLRQEWATRSQPDVGGVADGLSAWLDGRWPASRGEAQNEWEAPRIAPREKNTARRVGAMGDAIVPECAALLGFLALERAS